MGPIYLPITLKRWCSKKGGHIPVFKTIASQNDGITAITDFITSAAGIKNTRKEFLLAEKAYKLIQQERMADIDKAKLQKEIAKSINDPQFNLYNFVEDWLIKLNS